MKMKRTTMRRKKRIEVGDCRRMRSHDRLVFEAEQERRESVEHSCRLGCEVFAVRHCAECEECIKRRECGVFEVCDARSV